MVSLPLSLSLCVCVCVCVRTCVCVRVGGAGACGGGVRFSNSNRIIPSDYRILLLLKMPIPSRDERKACITLSNSAQVKKPFTLERSFR